MAFWRVGPLDSHELLRSFFWGGVDAVFFDQKKFPSVSKMKNIALLWEATKIHEQKILFIFWFSNPSKIPNLCIPCKT